MNNTFHYSVVYNTTDITGKKDRIVVRLSIGVKYVTTL